MIEIISKSTKYLENSCFRYLTINFSGIENLIFIKFSGDNQCAKRVKNQSRTLTQSEALDNILHFFLHFLFLL